MRASLSCCPPFPFAAFCCSGQYSHKQTRRWAFGWWYPPPHPTRRQSAVPRRKPTRRYRYQTTTSSATRATHRGQGRVRNWTTSRRESPTAVLPCLLCPAIATTSTIVRRHLIILVHTASDNNADHGARKQDLTIASSASRVQWRQHTHTHAIVWP